MGTDLANLIIANDIYKAVYSANQDHYSEFFRNKGIHSVTVSYRPFKYGEIFPGDDPSQVYRKFFYNEEGRVTKKFEFNMEGSIVTKEEATYDKNDKWKITERKIITAEDSFTETYEYNKVNGKQKLKRYTFQNSKWPWPKEDNYFYDSLGRINKKISKGLLQEPELITHYHYDTGKDTRVTYRYVTDPDEKLVFTVMYDYFINDGKKGRQKALYSFLKTPDEITELRGHKDWELESNSRTIWEYDKSGENIIRVFSDIIKPESGQPDDEEETGTNKSLITRILTEKTDREYDFDYEKKSKKLFLRKETEWLTRFDEPLKAVKEFKYYGKDGSQIYPQIPDETENKKSKD